MDEQRNVTPPPAEPPPAERRPPIAGLRPHWAVTLPLIALAAQAGVGFVVGVARGAGGVRALASDAAMLGAILGLSGIAYLLIVHILLKRNGWRWRDLAIPESPNRPVFAASAIGLVTAVVFAWITSRLQMPSFARARPVDFLTMAVAMGLLAPVGEEVLFRGVVYPVLRHRLADKASAMLISAVIFAAFHLNPAQIVVAFVLGLLLAWLREWSGALLAPIALHVTHNLGVLLLTTWRLV